MGNVDRIGPPVHNAASMKSMALATVRSTSAALSLASLLLT
jgi:hypothetical protein